MNRKTLLSAIGVMTIVLFIANGCKKDNTDSTTAKDYIDVENGTYHSGGIPAENSDANLASIYANTRALEGGSTPITINTFGTVTHLIVGIQGVTGYYQVAVTDLQLTSNGYTAIILFDNNLPETEFTLVTEMLNDADNIIASRTAIVVSTVEQSSVGKIQISLSWDLLNDIDLHLVEPSGNEIYYGNEGNINYDWEKIYADHPDDYYDLTESQLAEYILDDETTTGVLDLDSNPGCSIDSVNNENIIYIFPSDISTGEYIVRVDFFSDCVGTGTSNYIVTARYDNELITVSSGSNPSYGTFEAGTADYGGEGDGVEVMRFNINEVKSADKTQHIYLEKPHKSKISPQKVLEKLSKSKGK
jgi:hypothetical protein